MEILLNSELKHLEELRKLDTIVYDESDQISSNLELEWFNKNKDIYVMVLDDNKVVSYMNFMPLSKSAFDKFKKGELKDDKIKAKHIETYEPSGKYNLAIISAVVHPEYQNSDAVKLLLYGYYKKIEKLMNKGIKFDNVLGDCVSKDGEKLAERAFRLKYKTSTGYGSKIYGGKFTLDGLKSLVDMFESKELEV